MGWDWVLHKRIEIQLQVWARIEIGLRSSKLVQQCACTFRMGYWQEIRLNQQIEMELQTNHLLVILPCQAGGNREIGNGLAILPIPFITWPSGSVVGRTVIVHVI